jgi:crotonobetainyl-CoA:carnitine CoA-transferase CaiB-like acyl-CoA transferase
LSGIRVLDLGTVIAGAYTGAILASFGADVVKVEPAEGDPFRPYGTGFMSYNRGKRGLGLDLKSQAGRRCFLDMARTADVVLDNYRLGVRARLGIDYPALKAVNPRIISLSINCFGSKGQDAAMPGFDPLLQARSGLMSAQGGGPGCEPVYHAIPITDVATAAMGAFGVIAALYRRSVTGEGQHLETSLTAQSAVFQGGDLVDYAGRPARNLGGRDCLGLSALERYYPCANGWLCLACTRPGQFDALADALGHAEWRDRFPDPLGEARDGELAWEIEQALAGLPRDEAVEALRSAGAPATPVVRGHEAQGSEWLWDNGFYELRHHPHWGDLICGRSYADFSRGRSGYERLHPELGEHGLEVLLDYGIDRETIMQLAKDRVIFRG